MNIGRIIYGYCEGYFGRDHYGEWLIEAEGVDWIVVRDIDGNFGSSRSDFTSFKDEKEKQEKIKEWSKPNE
jgi:hypothetical protein